MDLSIVFVNWNSTEYLCDSIASIYEHTAGLDFEIVVVDNASPIRDVEKAKERFPGVILIQSEQNLGFAGANNLGFRHSLGEYVLFLNPDTKLVNDALGVMLRCARSTPDAGIVGCKLLNDDLSVQTTCARPFPTILSSIFEIDYLKERWPRNSVWGSPAVYSQADIPVKVPALSGACMMLSRDVFMKVRGFCEDYFMYAEDLDLCSAVTRAGYSNYYIGGGVIIHYGGKSSSSSWSTPVMWKARLQLFRKTYGTVYTLIFRIVMSAVAVLRLVVTGPFRGVRRKVHAEDARWSATLKWWAILRVLLTESGAVQRAAGE